MKRPLDVDVVEIISTWMDSLVQSMEDGVLYKDLEGLGRYVQWTLDDAQYEMSLTILRNDLRQRHEDRVERALVDFRTKNVGRRCPMGMMPDMARPVCICSHSSATPPAAMET